MEKTATVFVIDDDSGSRKGVSALVEAMGHTPIAFASAEEFLAKYKEVHPACIITDYRLLGISGLDLQLELVQRDIRLPLIIMTAYASTSLTVQAVKRGAVTLLDKPCRDQDLREAIEAALLEDQAESSLTTKGQGLLGYAFDLAPVNICVLDGAGKVIFSNRAWRQFAVEHEGTGIGSLKEGTHYADAKGSLDSHQQKSFRAGVAAVLSGDKPRFEFEYQQKTSTGVRSCRVEALPFGTAKQGVILTHEDITERRSSEAELTFRRELERLVSRLCVRLRDCEVDVIPQKIQESLEDIGKLTGSDHAYVSDWSDPNISNVAYNWGSPTFKGDLSTFAVGNQIPAPEIPWAAQSFRGEPVIIPDVTQMPESKFRERILATGLRSLLVVPTLNAGRLMGNIGLGYSQPRVWSKEDLSVLRIASEIIWTAYDRYQTATEQNRMEQHFKELLRTSQDAVWNVELSEPMPINLSLEEQLGFMLEKSVLKQCNRGFAAMNSVADPAALIGKPLRDVYGGDANFQERLRRFIVQDYIILEEPYIQMSKDGVRRMYSRTIHGVIERERLVRIWAQARDITQQGVEKSSDSALTLKTPKYETSRLSDQRLAELKGQLERLFASDRPYLEPNFTLSKLARLLHVPDHIVSQLLSLGFNTSFYDLINLYRIREVETMMKSPLYADKSILDLAISAGFNSKSTFNTAFKNITGKTPSEYRRSGRKAA